MNTKKRFPDGAYVAAQEAKQAYEALSDGLPVSEHLKTLADAIIWAFADDTLPKAARYDAFVSLLPEDALSDPQNTFLNQLERVLASRDFADYARDSARYIIARARRGELPTATASAA